MTGHPAAVADVLVVGGGPAGSAAAHRLADAGHRVVIVERRRVPRTKTCGDLITPRAVASLDEIGIGNEVLDRFQRVERVRLTEGDRSSSTTWPTHSRYPRHGFVARRDHLDQLLVNIAVERGASLLDGHTATAPIVERGFVRGAHITAPGGETFELRAGFTVVADGANSRFGRALGTFRQPSWPHALAHRAVFASTVGDDAEIELVLRLHDRVGTRITGFGWRFPRGDGTANIGVMMMSTSPSFQVVKPVHLLERFVPEHAERWGVDPTPIEPPAGGRIPLGNSVGPLAGATYVVVGDAAAAANPMTGEGIEYALETGLLAGEVISEAIAAGSAPSLQRYPKLLDERYGAYFKVGRLANRMLGRPAVARRVGRIATGRPALTKAFVRLTSNELRAGHTGLAEATLRLGRTLSIVAPDA